MHAGGATVGAGGADPIVGAAEADRDAQKRLRADAIVAAERAAADRLLGGVAARHRIGVEPLRAAERRAPGAPVARSIGSIARRRARSGAAGEPRALFLGPPRGGAVGQQCRELPAGGDRRRLADAGVVARQQFQRRRQLAVREPEQAGHGAKPGPGVERRVEGARDGQLVAAEPRGRRHHRLQVEGHVGGAIAQAWAEEAGQAGRGQVLERAAEAAGGRQDGVAARRHSPARTAPGSCRQGWRCR